MNTSNKRAIYVGVFIVIGIALLVAAVLTIGNLHSTFTRKITISTVFNDVSGLQPGNNIWFSGVKIGTVKKLEFNGGSQVHVIMNINSKAREYIHKDSKVKISSDGLIGNRILIIYGGSTNTPEIEEGDMLSNELTLSTDDILNTFQENNLNILKITRMVAEGQGTIGKLLSSDSVYRTIAIAAGSLEQAAAQTNALVASVADFSTKLTKKGTLFDDLATDTMTFNQLQASVFQLKKAADSTAAMVSELKAASNDPETPVGLMLHDKEAGKDIRSTIDNLEQSTKKVNNYLDALQQNILLRKYLRKEEKKKEKEEKKEKRK